VQGDEDDEPEKCKKCITGFALNLEKNFCYDVLGENQSFCIEMTASVSPPTRWWLTSCWTVGKSKSARKTS